MAQQRVTQHQKTQWWVAQDTFSAEIPPEGTPVNVTKGSTFPDGHPVLKLDGGREHLFKPQDQVPEPEPEPKATEAPAKDAKDAGK